MTTLTVTAKGQITLKKEFLQHLGVRPGQRIEAELLPDGRLSFRAERPVGSIENFIGFLAGETDRAATIDEINEAIADGWAGKR